MEDTALNFHIPWMDVHSEMAVTSDFVSPMVSEIQLEDKSCERQAGAPTMYEASYSDVDLSWS
jgi:hypothetical protein